MCRPQTPEKKGEAAEVEPPAETAIEPPDSASSSNSRSGGGGTEGGGVSAEQPFIKLSQEEYGEHHSSIMHCRSDLFPGHRSEGREPNLIFFSFLLLFSRVDCSGRRVASLDVDGVIKVIDLYEQRRLVY